MFELDIAELDPGEVDELADDAVPLSDDIDPAGGEVDDEEPDVEGGVFDEPDDGGVVDELDDVEPVLGVVAGLVDDEDDFDGDGVTTGGVVEVDVFDSR